MQDTVANLSTLVIHVSNYGDSCRPLSYQTAHLSELADELLTKAREAGLAAERPERGKVFIYSKHFPIDHMRTLVEQFVSDALRRISTENLVNIQSRNREEHADIG